MREEQAVPVLFGSKVRLDIIERFDVIFKLYFFKFCVSPLVKRYPGELDL